ncbi:unnamed protein product [Larinioides sclopetarius]|uniref:Uncharacterized protein n=1 Tax=Larinioides sclopetarius TaxID=280406 RepID=A0AAV1ZU11_9ARAC
MKSPAYFSLPIIVAVFLLGHVPANDANEANDRFLKNLECIFTSGNETYCEVFLDDCSNDMPPKLTDAYNKCVNEHFPDGLGGCSSSEEMKKSVEKRKQVNSCIMEELGSYQVTESDIEQLTAFNKCTANLARQLGCEASK